MAAEDEIHESTVVTPIPGFDKKERHAYLVFLTGPLVGKIHLLDEGTVTLGRGADLDIPINDPGISRHHVRIAFQKGKARIQDLGSTNGTYLNGRRIAESDLKDGDKIQISSNTILKYAYQDKIENIFHTELYRMAVVDPLTGAYNKRYFEERFKEEFSYSLRNRAPLSLLMIDIDWFKSVNDCYGHPAGDYVLTRVSEITASIIRKEDLLCRYGGEEFAVILKGTDSEGAWTLAERLRKMVDEAVFEFDGKKIHATVSIGVATLHGRNLVDYEQMIKAADTLLYKSKNAGRNRVSA